MKLRPLAWDFVEVKDGNEKWKISRGKYKAADVWSVIRPKKENVTWHKLVWSIFNVPKHAFLSWLAVLNRLPTKDRFRAWGWTWMEVVFFVMNRKQEITCFLNVHFSRTLERSAANRVINDPSRTGYFFFRTRLD